MITINSDEDLLEFVQEYTTNYSFNDSNLLYSAFIDLWELTGLVQECPYIKKGKKVMDKGICIFYEAKNGEVNSEFIVPKINYNSISLHIVSEKGYYDETGSPDNLEDIKKHTLHVAEIYKDRIDFNLCLKGTETGNMSFGTFACILHKVKELSYKLDYGDEDSNELSYGDGDLTTMFYAISDAYNKCSKSSKKCGKMEILNERFVLLFKNTGNSLKDVVDALKKEGFKDSEIYKSMVSTMKDITWEE